MKRTFILGNGFDLNLGLETSYSHFIKSENFKAYLKETSEGNRYSLAKHLKETHTATSWVDIEVELANYSRTRSDAKFLTEYRFLCETLSEYLLAQQEKPFNTNSAAFRLFTENHRYGDELEVITFNYTNTAEKVLHQIFKYAFMEDEAPYKITYIHGSANQNNIIFGVDDSHQILRHHSAIRKTTHPNFSGHLIRKALFEYVDEIHFFGISLGETDHMYFKEYFADILCKQSSNTEHIFYVYQQSGWDDLHYQFHQLTNQETHKLKIISSPKIIKLE